MKTEDAGTGSVFRNWIPFGWGRDKPHHYREMLRVAWENRDNLSYAWRILNQGVCDGCSLGPYGLKDDAMAGVHLCLTRLRMLRMNTMGPLDPGKLSDVTSLRKMSGEELRNLGRLPFPMIRRSGEVGFTRISWDKAFSVAAQILKTVDPRRFAIYTTSRGLTNEVYYVAGKFARLMGTNNIDNAARLCHAASTTALKQTVGIAASTCSYRDWIGTDLIVLAGANIANNQPVATKYLHYAKQKGTRIVVVNPFREPGLERYWIPSIARSALFGTRLMDDFFPILVGGDVAFCNGVMKMLIENDWLDRAFIEDRTVGFPELKRSIEEQSWESLETQSGTTRSEMLRFARTYAQARTAIFIWSMGLTQHRFGVENVKSLVNVALARGMIGRPHTGLVPIRGHSGVQGAAEVGSIPGDFFAGMPVNEENAKVLSKLWKFPVPHQAGYTTASMLEAAHDGRLDAFYILGGNFLDTMPDPNYAREALQKVPLRIHQDIILNSSMFAEPAGTVLLFPAQTRYEQRGGGTATSTERRVRFSPEIRGPRIGEARSEWEIIVQLAEYVLPPEKYSCIRFSDADAIRHEMDELIPLYKGIGNLKQEKDSFQYGGEMLLQDGLCPNLPEGKARFSALIPANAVPGDGQFYLTTRRGKQFNSIVYGTEDPLVGSKRRDEVFLCREDASKIGVEEGDRVVLSSDAGQFPGVIRIGPAHRGTVQVFWPEANPLIGRHVDPASQEPDYNTLVTIRPSGLEGS